MNDKVQAHNESGYIYPDKPSPRAWGYLDNSGVAWAAYDAGQMEAYSRESFNAGLQAGFDAVMAPAYKAGTVTEAMIDVAMDAYHKSYKGGQREWMRDALIAALANQSGEA